MLCADQSVARDISRQVGIPTVFCPPSSCAEGQRGAILFGLGVAIAAVASGVILALTAGDAWYSATYVFELSVL